MDASFAPDSHQSTALTATQTVPGVPSDLYTNSPKWGDNRAELPGFLTETGEHLRDAGKFIDFITEGVVRTTSGKIFVDSNAALSFIPSKPGFDLEHAAGVGEYSWDRPCPPTPARSKSLNDALIMQSKDEHKPDTTMDEALRKMGYIVSPTEIAKEDAHLLQYLMYALRDSRFKQRLKRQAAGSGRVLLGLLRDMIKDTTPAETATLVTKYENAVNNGVIGGLTTITVTAWLDAIENFETYVPSSAHLSDERKVLAVTKIAMAADHEIKTAYDLKMQFAQHTGQKATSYYDAAHYLMTILDERATCAEFVSVSENGLGGVAGVARGRESSQIDALTKKVSQLEALLARVDLTRDPTKGKYQNKNKVGDKDKVLAPRDADGRVTHWIKGMKPCDCGGEHLRRDCPEYKKDKSKPTQQTAALASGGTSPAEPDPPQAKEPHALHMAHVCELDDDELTSQLNAWFLEAEADLKSEEEPSQASMVAASGGPAPPSPEIKNFGNLVRDPRPGAYGDAGSRITNPWGRGPVGAAVEEEAKRAFAYSPAPTRTTEWRELNAARREIAELRPERSGRRAPAGPCCLQQRVARAAPGLRAGPDPEPGAWPRLAAWPSCCGRRRSSTSPA